MTTTRTPLLAVLLVALLLPVRVMAPSPAAASGASLRAFDREWTAHTRSARLRHQILRESVYSGCCERAAKVKYRLSRVHRKNGKVIARAVVLKARYSHEVPRRDRLHAGDVVRVWVKNTMLHTPTTFYCDGIHHRPACGA